MSKKKARRMFLKFIGIISLFSIGFFSIESTLRDKIIGKIMFKLNPPPRGPAMSEKSIAKLPAEGENISVETALNSRCNSDSTGNQKYHHWGMFARNTKLSQEQLQGIVKFARIPRFTDKKAEISLEKNVITFVVEGSTKGLLKDLVMVESGMQQQAVGLVCAALGVGLVFQNLGINGRTIKGNYFGTVKNILNPMKPSYNGSFWSTSPSLSRKSWQKGNLPDPIRSGQNSLVSVLSELKINNNSTKKATDADLSQLLWAARGRTPHYYKSKPWGLTIPFWTDKFDVSSVFLISKHRCHKYINWDDGRPTHSIQKIKEFDRQFTNALAENFPNYNNIVVLGRNDDNARALWEIGYQLINIMAQAHALQLSYQAALLDETQKSFLRSTGIDEPVALVTV